MGAVGLKGRVHGLWMRRQAAADLVGWTAGPVKPGRWKSGTCEARSLPPRHDESGAPLYTKLDVSGRPALGLHHFGEHFVHDIQLGRLVGLMPAMIGTPGPDVLCKRVQGHALLQEHGALALCPSLVVRPVLDPLHVAPAGLGRRHNGAIVVLDDAPAGPRPVRSHLVVAVRISRDEPRGRQVARQRGVAVAPKGEGAAGPDDARQLWPQPRVVEPVGGLGGDDEVDAAVGEEGQSLCAGGAEGDVGKGGRVGGGLGLGEHACGGVGGGDAVEVRGQGAGDEGVAGAEVEGVQAGPGGVVGEHGVVERGRVGGAAGGVAGVVEAGLAAGGAGAVSGD